jgi:prepilin-type N-terminal cleavage/methylation domain-containing protein
VQATLERLRRRREEEGDEGGFTLIELLIVIVILGILAAIVVFAVQNLSTSSSQASCGSDYKTVETAVEAFKAQIGVYPGDPTIGAGNPWTVTVGTPAAGYPGTAATMSQLLGTATSGSSTSPIGPWLKDTPYNPGHYSISVTYVAAAAPAPANATIGVLDGAGNPVASCALLTS